MTREDRRDKWLRERVGHPTGRRMKRLSDAKKLAVAGLVLLALAFIVVLNVWRFWHFVNNENYTFTTRFVMTMLAAVVFFAVLKRRDR